MTDTCNRQLRDILNRRETTLLPGAANALAARIIEDIGFKAIYVSGAGVTNTYLGVPDIGLISVTELADHVAAMREAVPIPASAMPSMSRAPSRRWSAPAPTAFSSKIRIFPSAAATFPASTSFRAPRWCRKSMPPSTPAMMPVSSSWPVPTQSR
jgi:Phosphoenolpyruvate phosphomutase